MGTDQAAVQPASLSLSAGEIAAFVRRHAGLRAERVEPLGAGLESVAWRVDGAWVARFATTPGARAALGREVALAPLLGEALAVPVPRFERIVDGPGGEPLMSTYRLLDGVPLSVTALDALSERARTRALDEFANVLTALREIPAQAARAAGARLRPHEGFGHPDQRGLHHRHAARLGPEDVARIEALWRAYESGGDLVLAHADLKPEHVLHDPETGRLTGVLDWGDACLAHRDYDLAVTGLFFSAQVRDDLARRIPDGTQVATTAGLLIATRWLCDLDVGAPGDDEPFRAMCAAELAEHLSGLAAQR